MVNGKIIKVCGMREAENIQEIESLQDIDMLGFIFYPKSPRYVYELPAYLPIHTHRVGVFVNEDKQIVSMYADRFGLNYVQLHGNESPEYCRSLYSMGIKIIKAFSISHPKDLKNVYKYEKSVTFSCSIPNANNTAAPVTCSTGIFCIPITVSFLSFLAEASTLTAPTH